MRAEEEVVAMIEASLHKVIIERDEGTYVGEAPWRARCLYCGWTQPPPLSTIDRAKVWDRRHREEIG